MISLDKGARLWLHKTAKKHYWRVYKWYDLDDLIQDGYLHYCRVAAKYPEANRPQIMSLFKRTFLNHIHDLSKRRTRCPDLSLVEDLQTTPLMIDPHSDMALVQVAMDRSPKEVRSVFCLLASADGCRRLRSSYRVYRDRRETLNDRLCRLTGTPEGTDLVGMLKSYLSQTFSESPA